MNGDVIRATTPILDARPDTLDFRDRMYEATLYEVQPASCVAFHVFGDHQDLDNRRMFAFIRLANVLLSSFAQCPYAHSMRGPDSLFCRIADFCLS